MEKFLIALDLDGTLLNNQGKVSLLTKTVLRYLQKLGHLIVITTGRSVRISEHIYYEIGLKGPMINSNGAHGHKPTHVKWKGNFEQAISKTIAQKIIALQKQVNIGWIGIENKTQVFVTTEDLPKTNFFPIPTTPINLINLSSDLTVEPISLCWFMQLDEQETVKQLLLENIEEPLDVRTWGGELPCLEVTPLGVNKASALQKLLTYYQMTTGNLIAFGDEHNDYEMLALAQYGVAMLNATDEIKQVAKDVTRYSNDDDGVAKYLIEFFNLTELKK